MLVHVIRFLRSWQRATNVLRELSLLSDRELADIGVRREDIPHVAWEASER
jgi:uncharacterized protein YjiS (DUF1127 family)